ncbi:MAG: hypothetical protein ACUVUB_01975 [Candidatus Bathyarchaeia archaeon]
MGKVDREHHRRVVAAAAAYILVGAYFIAFSIPDLNLLLLLIIGLGSIITGLGLYMFKRWGFWLASALFPLLATASLSTLIFSLKIPVQDSTFTSLILDLSLTVMFILTVASFLTVLSVRDDFKL